MNSSSRKTAIPGLLGAALLWAAPTLASGPGVVKFDEASYFASEGNTVQVMVERSQGEDGPASVRVLSNGGSATPGADFSAVDVVLTWAANDGSDRFVAIPLSDDAAAEPAETIQLLLVDATGAGIDPERASTTISIGDNDGGGGGSGGGGCEPGDDSCGGGSGGGGCEPGDDSCGGGSGGSGGSGGGADSPNGVFKFDERSFYTSEGAGVAVITVERSHGEDGAVSVAYFAQAGSATADEDFTEVAGTFT